MTAVDRESSTSPVPYAIDVADRVRKERYFDPDFYRLECESSWPRVWQMACRLEEIPRPRDYVEYEILDQSIVLVRGDDMEVRAFENACRHRGVRSSRDADGVTGFNCPFHGWRYGLDGKNTGVTRGARSPSTTSKPGDIDLVPVRCETWGGCAWINFDHGAPPLRQCLEPAATVARRLEGRVASGREVVRVPPARELEARHRGVRRDVPRRGDASRNSSSRRGSR